MKSFGLDRPTPFWTRHLRREFQFVLDAGVLTASFLLAYLLRFDFQIPPGLVQKAMVQLPFVVLLQMLSLGVFGVYSFVWRYVGMAEIRSFVLATASASIPIFALRLLLPSALSDWRVPLSVTLMDGILAFAGLLGIRIARRALYERYERKRERHTEGVPENRGGSRTILVGAGQAGLLAARELQRQNRTDLEVIGFVDDDTTKHGTVIHGVKVLGGSTDLTEIVSEHKVERAVITMARAPREVIRGFVNEAQRLGLKVQIMPALYEILEGRVNVSRFRTVQIEDVLGREAVKLEEASIRGAVEGRCVMVTGAGGSIGGELARQVARFGPKKLLLVERAEPALFDIHRDLLRLWPTLEIRPVLADVRDRQSVERIFAHCRPAVVLHAAAHKHVPLVESNVSEGIANNCLGTWSIGRLAARFSVDRFVLVSTDKAVNPTSAMGTTKRVAELFVQELDRRHPDTQFVAVRFGNVLGSTGSVVPIFREQIESGGPVTVTHPDMVRYFMTIPEAAQLVLQAGVIGEGGEIFLLDMGEPVKIVDLARDMIRLAGLEPERDVEIVFSGVRPGEKLFEELGYGGEELCKTKHPKIFVGRLEPYESARIEAAVERLEALVKGGDEVALRRYLAELVPEATLEGLGGERGRAVGAGDERESGERVVLH